MRLSLVAPLDMFSPLIDIQWLTRAYPGTTKNIFSHLFLSINKDDFCFVVGKSGIGKTTLVKFLIRQLQPPMRMIYHKKEDIARFTPWEVQRYRKRIGVIYQDYKLIDRKNVADNIAYPLEIAGIEKSLRTSKVAIIAEQLWLTDKLTTGIHQLSWGEKQRVAIARALVNDPEFIIADEATGNLDREASQKIADTLIGLNRAGNTIVCITHDRELIAYVQRQQPIKIVELHP